MPDTFPRRAPERPRSRPCPSASMASGSSLPGSHQTRIMKLMTTDRLALAADGAVAHERRLPIAEIHLALRIARHMAEQTQHGVGRAVRIFQRLAQNHETTALAVNGPVLRGKPCIET